MGHQEGNTEDGEGEAREPVASSWRSPRRPRRPSSPRSPLSRRPRRLPPRRPLPSPRRPPPSPRSLLLRSPLPRSPPPRKLPRSKGSDSDSTHSVPETEQFNNAY